jgi:hypothetical protein
LRGADGSTRSKVAQQEDGNMLRQRLIFWAGTCGVLFGLVMVGGLTNSSAAATISYADQGPVGGVTFTAISESSFTDPVPLYGPPSPFTIGLDFDPMNFGATANGGAMDVTDGQLNFTATTASTGKISTINLLEAGDYSLTGTGTSATQALAGVIIRATITQVNGANVTPFNLAPVNVSLSRNLAANPGIVQPWSLNASLNVASQVAAQFGATARATKVEIVIDNQLQALSQTSSLAFIAKKDFRIDIDGPIIPEPATVGLLLGSVGLALAVRRSSR